MADFPNIEPDAEQIGLVANTQIYESPLTRGVQTASLNGSRWMASPTYNNRQGKDARDLRAFIFNQDGAAGRFNYYPFTVDNQGTHAGGGVVDGAGQVGKSLLTKGWDADQPLLFATGDYLTINGEMKMVTADVPVGQDYIEYDETNYMPSPFDPIWWPNVSNGIKTIITDENPSGISEFALLEQTGTGYYTPLESYDENLSVLAGDIVYQCLLVKAVSGSNDFSFVMFTDGVNETGKSLTINGDTLDVKSSQYDDVKITELTDGWKLIQGKRIIVVDDPDMLSRVTFLQPDSGLAAPIGSQLYVQAVFVGKSNDWPAKLRANATIPITPALRVSPSDGNAIEADNPYFPARLETDDQSKLQVSSNLIYNTTLSIVEDF